METSEISKYSLDEIQAFVNLKSDNSGNSSIEQHKIHANISHPFRINAFIIGVCTEGELEFSINLQNVRIRKNQLFICGPNSMLQVQSRQAFQSDVIALSEEFMEKVHIDIKRLMPLFLKFTSYPSIHLSEQDSSDLRTAIKGINTEIKRPESYFHTNLICSMVSTLIYRLGDILHAWLSLPTNDRSLGSPSRAEEYFSHFMKLLTENYKHERSVNYYAKQLCITPKYLTTLIRQVSGKSVSEWICAYVILEAKTMLKNSTMSIQEIAYALNFPNQSFFGSYFKRNTGLSPLQYRMQ